MPNDPTTAMIQVRGMIQRRYHAASGPIRGPARPPSLNISSLWPTVVGQINRSAAMRAFEIGITSCSPPPRSDSSHSRGSTQYHSRHSHRQNTELTGLCNRSEMAVTRAQNALLELAGYTVRLIACATNFGGWGWPLACGSHRSLRCCAIACGATASAIHGIGKYSEN